MTSGARVRSVDALTELRAALVRFAAEAQEGLAAAEQEVRRTEAWLQERHQHWRGEVQRREGAAQQAEMALRRCLASGDRDHPPSCGAYERALADAIRLLREAQEELQKVQRWMKAVGEAAGACRAQAQRLSRLCASEIPKAEAFLGRKTADLEGYLGLGFAAAAGAAVGLAGAAVAGGAAALGRSGGATGVRETGPGWRVGGGAEAERLGESLERLRRSRAGGTVAGAIQGRETGARFGEMPQGAIAYFDPERNEIVLDARLRDASPNVIAAHLAHEGTHVQWGSPSSIDQEYHAFRAQAEVWEEIKGAEVDEVLDRVSGMISQGEARAKLHIGRLYPELW